MKKKVSFMRKDFYTENQMQEVIDFLNPLFANNNFLFKEKIRDKSAYLDDKRFTYVLDDMNHKKYRIMGNCVGSIIYVRDILDINDPDTHLLDNK